MEARGDTLCASTFGVAEVLAGPWKTGARKAADRHVAFFRSPDIRLIDFRLSSAGTFAEIRGSLGVPAPDAIHLASAAEARADLFLTRDRRLAGKAVAGSTPSAT